MKKLDQVATVRWSSQQGLRLVELRGKLSRQKLSLHLHDLGIECSSQNLHKIERGTAQTVPIETLYGIAQVLGVPLATVIPGLIVDEN